MKQYKAKANFHGVITLKKGEIKALDPASVIVQDLIKAHLIAEVEEKKKTAKKTTKKAKAEKIEAVENETKGAE